MDKQVHAIGIDIGGTKINIGVVDEQGVLQDYKQIPTNISKGPCGIEQEIIEQVRLFEHYSIAGIGVGIAGQIDPKSGTILASGNLKWVDVPLQANLSAALKIPVTVTNDVRAATWAEWLYGAGKGSHDLICLFVGTGIGGGIVINGKILNGFSNTAGEVGHMIVQKDGAPCSCGNFGCWEAYASGWGIAHRTRKMLKENPDKESILRDKFKDIQEISAKHLIQAYREGDLFALKVVQETYEWLLIGINTLANALNPEKIVLGGGIISGLPGAIDYIRKELPHKPLTTATKNLKIHPAKHLEDAGMIGAGALALNNFAKLYKPRIS